MSIHVYHNPDFLDYATALIINHPPQVDLSRLYLAAVVDTNDPETAYQKTQHLDREWHDSPGITTVVRSRSTSVGDVLALPDGRLLVVASYGFEPLPGAILPADASTLVGALQTIIQRLAAEPDSSLADLLPDLKTAVTQAHALYTALTFVVPVLDYLAAQEDNFDLEACRQALMARFGREQAAWALEDIVLSEPAKD
ncbi:MAG: hypothetical protein L0332_29685 [Chloroflexi bacterium]|nr:hypothetical protein [Chloroflexota bacterium]MCI0730872.1 hypothetical protein [Chloroflexota bacterium]